MGPMQGAKRNQQRLDAERARRRDADRAADPDLDTAGRILELHAAGAGRREIARQLGLKPRELARFFPPQT